MERKAIRVIIIDDHPWIRKSLQLYLASCPDITVVGTAAAADKGLGLALSTQPDVAVIDLHLPPRGQDNSAPGVFTHGIRLINTLHQRMPKVAVVAFTGFMTSLTTLAAWRAGARICLPKNYDGPQIANAIRAIFHGEDMESEDPCPGSLQSLTDRELEVLHLVGQGLSNQQIASQLYISDQTVNSHLKHLYGKLGISRRVEAAAFALY